MGDIRLSEEREGCELLVVVVVVLFCVEDGAEGVDGICGVVVLVMLFFNSSDMVMSKVPVVSTGVGDDLTSSSWFILDLLAPVVLFW